MGGCTFGVEVAVVGSTNSVPKRVSSSSEQLPVTLDTFTNTFVLGLLVARGSDGRAAQERIPSKACFG